MRNRISVSLIVFAIVTGVGFIGCDGELSDGLPEVLESSSDSCTSCHQSPPAPPHPADDRCFACHGESVDSDGQTIAGGKHLNKTVEFEVTGCDVCHAYPPADPHPEVTVCAPCHASSVTAEEAIDWEGGNHANGAVEVAVTSAGCSLCHGYPPAEPHPQSDDCGACHGKTVDADGALLPDSDAHYNGEVDVAVAAGSCDLCHGNPPAPPHPAESGCAKCHSATVDADGAMLPDSDAHYNGEVDVAVAAGSCDLCHGNPPAPPHPAESACTECHAATVDDAGEFVGDAHVNGSVDLKITTAACGKCHEMPPSGGHPDNANCGICHGCVSDGDWNLVNEDMHINGKTDFAIPPNCE